MNKTKRIKKSRKRRGRHQKLQKDKMWQRQVEEVEKDSSKTSGPPCGYLWPCGWRRQCDPLPTLSLLMKLEGIYSPVHPLIQRAFEVRIAQHTSLPPIDSPEISTVPSRNRPQALICTSCFPKDSVTQMDKLWKDHHRVPPKANVSFWISSLQ